MIQGSGTSVFPGIAIGLPFVYQKPSQHLVSLGAAPEEERKKFKHACSIARQQLTDLFETVIQTLSTEEAAIVEVQLMMLEDLDFLEPVLERIALGSPAGNAVMATGESLGRQFEALDDAYMQARAADIRDLSSRVSDILQNRSAITFPESNFILIAEDLSPSETLRLPRDRVLGFITQKGSTNSHTAILSRMLGIPSLVQSDIDLSLGKQHTLCAIDSFAGTWYLNPDAKILSLLRNKQRQTELYAQQLQQYQGLPTITKSGKTMHLYANIGSVEDAVTAQEKDAEGIGLMRSELLYMGRNAPPTEEDLFLAYRQIASVMQGKPVIIRTLDIGADKQVDYLALPTEENPALGLRGLRYCLSRQDLFKTQLRAIYRASVFGDVQIMFPMISSLWELREAKQLCAFVRDELTADDIAFHDIPIGMMVETPAAAILASDFAKEVDFFSVGTNDLLQYTLAVDRQNPALGRFYDSHHPALLKLLEHIGKSAQQAGIWAGICGELATDLSLTEDFISMGFTELSVPPGLVLAIRKLICESEV